MTLHTTPNANRIHIGIFGKRNAGKSSVINALTGQSLAIVSSIKGTTTDPVSKSMELLPLGPVVIIDTPGIDDEGSLGTLRINKTYEVLRKIDIAVLVVDSEKGMTTDDNTLLTQIEQRNLPYLIVMNKLDLLPSAPTLHDSNTLFVSTTTGENINQLKKQLALKIPRDTSEFPIIADLITPKDFIILVTPIDSSAPKGRLILPQQQTLREILDVGAVVLVTQVSSLKQTLENMRTLPKLVVTDSQVFKEVNTLLPASIPLTSFSILFARHKGDLKTLIEGASVLDSLKDGDSLLISEGCTHHRQCGDIGTEKLPKLLSNYTGKEVNFHFTSGGDFPLDLNPYRLVIHCGGCMLNEQEMKYRIQSASSKDIPITNYGIALAKMQGILERCIAPFPRI